MQQHDAEVAMDDLHEALADPLRHPRELHTVPSRHRCFTSEPADWRGWERHGSPCAIRVPQLEAITVEQDGDL